MSTGYQEWRAERHDDVVLDVVAVLQERGYRAFCLYPDGHRPDIWIEDVGYLDVKTQVGKYVNFSVELDAVVEWRALEAERKRVFVLLVDRSGSWFVDTPDTLLCRVTAPGDGSDGPHRSSGVGSNDDWILIRPGGTPFDDFFRVL